MNSRSPSRYCRSEAPCSRSSAATTRRTRPSDLGVAQRPVRAEAECEGEALRARRDAVAAVDVKQARLEQERLPGLADRGQQRAYGRSLGDDHGHVAFDGRVPRDRRIVHNALRNDGRDRLAV